MSIRENITRQLADGPALLSDLIASIPPERLTHDFGGGVWTVHEHVQHLALTQIMLQKRIQLFFKAERPEIVPYVPDQRTAASTLKPVPELLVLFAEWRGRQVDSLNKADDAVWRKKAVHPEYESYDFHIAVRHILLHDGFHFYRIEELGFSKAEFIKPL